MANLKLVTAKDKNGEQKKTEIRIGEVTVGKDFLVIAGSCSVDPKNRS